MFGLTEKDADNIATGISSCPKLKVISVRNSKVTDTLLYDVVGGIDKLQHISHLGKDHLICLCFYQKKN